MKNTKLFMLLIAICMTALLTVKTNAQAPPVRIRLSQPPPGQLGASDLWKASLTNTSGKEMKIYLKGTATEEKDGLIVEGTTKTFIMPAGTREYKYEDFKNGDVAWKNNRYKDVVLRTGQAPEGNYTICMTAMNEQGEIVGMENCISQIVGGKTQGELTLISPSSGEEIDPNQPLIFSWSGPNTNGPYTLKIVEVKGEQSPEEAMKTKNPFFQQEGLKSTTFQYSSSAPRFEKGRKYAWMIKSGEIKSDISLFINIGKENPNNCDITASIDSIKCNGNSFNSTYSFSINVSKPANCMFNSLKTNRGSVTLLSTSPTIRGTLNAGSNSGGKSVCITLSYICPEKTDTCKIPVCFNLPYCMMIPDYGHSDTSGIFHGGFDTSHFHFLTRPCLNAEVISFNCSGGVWPGHNQRYSFSLSVLNNTNNRAAISVSSVNPGYVISNYSSSSSVLNPLTGDLISGTMTPSANVTGQFCLKVELRDVDRRDVICDTTICLNIPDCFHVGQIEDTIIHKQIDKDTCGGIDSISINTGLNHFNNLLYNFGSNDEYWKINNGSTSTPSWVVENSGINLDPSDWMWHPPFANTQWISIANNSISGNGNITYQFKFCLSNIDNAIINMSLMADNNATVFLNDNFVAETINGVSFFGTDILDITENNSTHFQNGQNTIKVVVLNANNNSPTGLCIKGVIKGNGLLKLGCSCIDETVSYSCKCNQFEPEVSIRNNDIISNIIQIHNGDNNISLSRSSHNEINIASACSTENCQADYEYEIYDAFDQLIQSGVSTSTITLPNQSSFSNNDYRVVIRIKCSGVFCKTFEFRYRMKTF